ncbi:hypothetical protein F2Q70_00017891 [Brassica cretica]|uniref:Adenylosuccinate lyase PurB C-terminal domain-containing protein n=1 Tax=Brassica cretica TaxID=69181 RepID=A0A8S9KL40_BRACR|nr:hypothetical protein F2Q70_00017891 [Brassica cretica]KAF2595950.1 hypothetical protein F2Q68_00010868 [Brassica cretica]
MHVEFQKWQRQEEEDKLVLVGVDVIKAWRRTSWFFYKSLGFEIDIFIWRFHPEKTPEVLESAPHRLQSPSGIPRRRSQLLPISELHHDQASSSCSAVIVGLQIRRRESFDPLQWIIVKRYCLWMDITGGKLKDLASSMSEFGLIYFRVLVEIKWLIKLSKFHEVTEVPSFSKDDVVYLQGIIDGFSMDDALEVKKIERVLEFFHFACTSEYINNLSHGLMLREALTSVILPAMDDLIKSVSLMAKDFATLSSCLQERHTGNQEARLKEDLDQTWEVLAEPIQTVMRRYGVPERYEKPKELTRGGAVNEESIREFIKGWFMLEILVYDDKIFS